MNAEMIELYKAVQGRRGEWQVFDSCLHPNRGVGTITRIFQKDMCLEIAFPGGNLTYFHTKDPKDLLWLPPVYSDDGRCLWAWVDWNRWDLTTWSDGKVLITPQAFTLDDPRYSLCINGTLPEALLRVIAEQEGGHE